MNSFEGKIINVENYSIFNFLSVDVNGQIFISLTLQLNENFKAGGRVNIFFKETEVFISKKSNEMIGVENVIKTKLLSVTKGDFFSELTLDSQAGNIKVILTNDSIKKNILTAGETIYAIIKANEISLSIL